MIRRALSIEAPAKINLHLRVGARRPDGYHDLDTVFQAISLFDTVVVSVGGAGSGAGVTLEVEGADLGPPETNLAYRAAIAFADRMGDAFPVRIRLVKRIPAGAGLGGGSSDAAAVLLCMAELAGMNDETLLHEIGASLGADVPFFLGPGVSARGIGRGDELTWLPARPSTSLVLSLPPVHVSTAEAYTALAARRVAASVESGSAALAGASSQGRAAAESPANDFTEVVSARHAEIGASLEGLLSEGAQWALLSGSGAACFGIFSDPESAERAAAALASRLGWRFETAHTLEARPRPRAV